MALVGEMQYLTIGNDTYSLPTGGGGGGSVTSVAVSNATNGGLSVSGSPITSSGTISIGHSNVLTSAQSTSAVYPITIDKNGHIASYGSAVTIPTITLNGSASTSPSFYAPTSAGTSGYVLISSGSGAPGWTSATLTDTKVTQTDNSTESTNRMLLMSDRAPSNNTTHDGGAKTSSYLYFQPSTGKLAAGYNTHNAVEIQPTLMKFHYSDNGSNYILSLQIPDLSVVSDPSPTITLPNKNGIIALTSDIPTVPTNVSAFTNDAGYTTNTGTVTSVGISNATNGGLNISGSPITSSGTITIGLDTAYGDMKNPYGSKTANYVLAGPTSGSAAAPSFRALVAADIPDLSGTYSTTDEKVKVESASVTTTTYYPILATGSDTSTRKYHNQFTVKYTSTTDPKKFQIQLGNGLGVQGLISLSNAGSSGGHTTIQTGASSNVTLTLPSSTGTIALTSDIPTVPTNVSAFNNDAGYLTSHQTIPVTDVTLNGSSIVSGGIAAITNASGDLRINGSLTTGDIIFLPNGYGLKSHKNGDTTTERYLIGYTSANNLAIGQAAQASDYVAGSGGGITSVYGRSIEFYTGESGSVTYNGGFTAGGNLYTNGSITAHGHGTQIGYKPDQTSNTASYASSTSWRVLTTPTLELTAGTWVIIATVDFTGNTTGDRGVGITYNSTSGNIAHSRHTQRAGNYTSIADILHGVAIQTITANRTYQVEIFQNSGSSLSTTARLNAVRIA